MHHPSTGSHPEAALQKLFSWHPLAAAVAVAAAAAASASAERRAEILNEVLEEQFTSVQPE